MNTQERHSEMVRVLVKDPVQILKELTPEKVNLDHAAKGVAGEAGELVDAIKKHTVYNHELNVNNVVEELGDLEFYMEQVRQQVGVTREMTLLSNIAKLSERYKNFEYSDQQAKDRADKKV